MAKPSFELVLVAVWLLTVLREGSGFSSGSPDYLCKSMKPLHLADGQPFDTLPFSVTADRATVPPGGVVTVTIANQTQFDQFRGFLAVASDSGDNVVSGMVTPPPSTNLKRQDCRVITTLVPDSAITHRDRLMASAASFQWRAPLDAVISSRYTIRVTVVQYMQQFWVGVPVYVTVSDDAGQPQTPSGTTTSQNTGTTSTQRVQGTTGVNTHDPSTRASAVSGFEPLPSTSTATGPRVIPASSSSPSSFAIPQSQTSVGSQFNRFSPDTNLVDTFSNQNSEHSISNTSSIGIGRSRAQGRRGMLAWLSRWFEG